MIPGSISKISESVVASANIIKVESDLVRLTGSTQINTIMPGLGTAQGQYLMLMPIEGDIRLGTSGNILNGATLKFATINILAYSKLQQKWVPEVNGLGNPVRESGPQTQPYDPNDFTAVGGTWTVGPWVPGPPSHGLAWYFWNILGSQVTISIFVYDSVISAGVSELHVRVPALLRNRGSIGIGMWHDETVNSGIIDQVGFDFIRLLANPGFTFRTNGSILLQISYMIFYPLPVLPFSADMTFDVGDRFWKR